MGWQGWALFPSWGQSWGHQKPARPRRLLSQKAFPGSLGNFVVSCAPVRSVDIMTSTLATEVGLLGGCRRQATPAPSPHRAGLSRGQERPCLLSLPQDQDPHPGSWRPLGYWAQPTCHSGPKGAPDLASAEPRLRPEDEPSGPQPRWWFSLLEFSGTRDSSWECRKASSQGRHPKPGPMGGSPEKARPSQDPHAGAAAPTGPAGSAESRVNPEKRRRGQGAQTCSRPTDPFPAASQHYRPQGSAPQGGATVPTASFPHLLAPGAVGQEVQLEVCRPGACSRGSPREGLWDDMRPWLW